MAFNLDNLSRGSFINGGTVWRYATTDGVADIQTTDYFSVAWPEMHAGDIILASTANGLAVLDVKSSDKDSVSVSISVTSSIQFDTSGTGFIGEGQISWNEDDQTLNIGTENDTVVQVGQEVLMIGRNVSGTPLLNGEIVFISGASGERPAIDRPQANAVSGDSTIGIVTQISIEDNASGFVTLLGLVRDIDTSAWNEGDPLWLSESVAGAVTNIRPDPPDRAIRMGFVVRKHVDSGVIFARPIPGLSVNDLHDVVITNPNDGDIITFDSATGTWVNEPQGD
jgi:hypothetical protein